jgi:hypothetical protein
MNEVNQPDACVKSAAFERFIRKRLFPVNKYDLLLENQDTPSNTSDDAGAAKEPYFKFKSRESGREFCIDARYLTGVYNASVEWCQPFELKRYREIDNNVPVYILIGAGQHPAAPQQVFLFPVKSIRFNKVLHSYIEKYKISTTRSVDEKDLA